MLSDQLEYSVGCLPDPGLPQTPGLDYGVQSKLWHGLGERWRPEMLRFIPSMP